MKKRAFLRGMIGFPLGIAIGYCITILISLCWGQGQYFPCVPALVDTMRNEISAVILQAVLCGLLGASFAAGSVIWELETWSIAKQTAIYFLITAIAMLPIAYLTNWMEHSWAGFIRYFGIFSAIFVVVWAIQYVTWKNRVTKINAKLEK